MGGALPVIYLDNAATSWPKPECVAEAVARFIRDVGANPGRSGHRLANRAEQLRLDAREAVAELVGVADPMRVVFALNGTTALNMVLAGLLPPGSHAVTTGMEHNSVLRPLRRLQGLGVSVSVVPCHPDGRLDAAMVDDFITPRTRLIVVNHASNVCGTILPVRQIGAQARARGIPLLVDAAQSAGVVPIDMQADNIDLLAFTGHKGLLGPSGTGGLVIRDDFDIDRLPPLVCGGTGSLSEQEWQPDFLPDKYEGGTPNTAGLAGLAAGVRYVLDRGVGEIRAQERLLTQRLLDGLGRIPAVRLTGTCDPDGQTATVSFVLAGLSCSAAAAALDERFDVICRPGLHCAPRAHQTLGTLPGGTVRFAPGLFSTPADVDQAIDAVTQLLNRVQSNE